MTDAHSSPDTARVGIAREETDRRYTKEGRPAPYTVREVARFHDPDVSNEEDEHTSSSIVVHEPEASLCASENPWN
ncbi:uncharacterized protein [Pleurodeles waltl]|uniref:uncharacterized protein isoform X2 n=1 Tax=Pleurodeles waltl TaxID=8319 RepID=UPI0037099503